MCVLALAWRAHPRWRVVLAGNRDEFHARPAAPLARWEDRPRIVAGRDLSAGGTWLGVAAAKVGGAPAQAGALAGDRDASPGTSDRGAASRLVVVTNLRGHGERRPDKASRGRLVLDQLAGEGDYADPPAPRLDDFNPFNLIVVAGGEARFLTNRPAPLIAALAPGLYGLSNGALDEPWPKTLRLKERLLGWLTAGSDDPAGLFAALREEAIPAAGLPPAAPSDIAQEPRDSAIFIRDPVYGTRCSTVVTIERDGQGTIRERRFDADGKTTGETAEAFVWSSPSEARGER